MLRRTRFWEFRGAILAYLGRLDHRPPKSMSKEKSLRGRRFSLHRPRKYNSTSASALCGLSKSNAAKLFIGLQCGPEGKTWQRPVETCSIRPMISFFSSHLIHQTRELRLSTSS
jgi:hypothetical protein